MKIEKLYPCPICGYLQFGEPPGSYAICPICFWEDDPVQLAYPLWATGANGASLYEYQCDYLAGKIKSGRRPKKSDVQDPGWRPLDPTRDRCLRHRNPADVKMSALSNAEPEKLYWWRPDYLKFEPTGSADA